MSAYYMIYYTYVTSNWELIWYVRDIFVFPIVRYETAKKANSCNANADVSN